jgi:hypothetical protein
MIPIKTLLADIEKFDKRFKELDTECGKAKEGGEIFIEWYKMRKAWIKFSNSVEFDLRPFVE